MSTYLISLKLLLIKQKKADLTCQAKILMINALYACH